MKEKCAANYNKKCGSVLEILKSYFPECFDDTANFKLDIFKNKLLENGISVSLESYGLEWIGKSYAGRLVKEPSNTLLKPDQIHNTKPENLNSENLLIKGDNLEALKHLLETYFEKVKMIYIDPPYNTGSDGFLYNDKFTINQEGSKEEKNSKKSKNNSHSAWLTFMYPRLHLARELLKEDGAIFISIDDSEVAQLRLLLDEIFGEENFICTFVWATKKGAQGMLTKNLVVSNHEAILVYAKNSKKFRFIGLQRDISQFSNPDGDPRGPWKRQYLQRLGQGLPIRRLQDPLTGNVFEFESPYSQEKLENWIQEGKIIFPKEANKYPARKEFLNEYVENKQLVTFLGLYATKASTEKLYKLFDNVKIFTNPKPTDLIQFLIKATTESGIILDFFAGSGTTGEAVMQLNAEDGGKRKFILVQIAESIDPKKNKAIYEFVNHKLKVEPTIFEITKERLIRAAKKIKSNAKNIETQDFGFKILELIQKDLVQYPQNFSSISL